MEFYREAKRFLQWGQKWWKFILPLETKKAFFAKNLIKKFQI